MNIGRGKCRRRSFSGSKGFQVRPAGWYFFWTDGPAISRRNLNVGTAGPPRGKSKLFKRIRKRGGDLWLSDRRMISKRIVENSRFLKLSDAAQKLYLHLMANTDDDGIVEAFTVIVKK